MLELRVPASMIGQHGKGSRARASIEMIHSKERPGQNPDTWVFKVGRCLTFQGQYFPKLTERLEEGKMASAL